VTLFNCVNQGYNISVQLYTGSLIDLCVCVKKNVTANEMDFVISIVFLTYRK